MPHRKALLTLKIKPSYTEVDFGSRQSSKIHACFVMWTVELVTFDMDIKNCFCEIQCTLKLIENGLDNNEMIFDSVLNV